MVSYRPVRHRFQSLPLGTSFHVENNHVEKERFPLIGNLDSMWRVGQRVAQVERVPARRIPIRESLGIWLLSKRVDGD
jgi:hypothetical protein